MFRLVHQQTVEQAVQSYISLHATQTWPVATNHAVTAIRNTLPDAEHTDAELAELVAAAAIRAGCPVFFAGKQAFGKEVSQHVTRS
jgi:hypothetical protein